MVHAPRNVLLICLCVVVARAQHVAQSWPPQASHDVRWLGEQKEMSTAERSGRAEEMAERANKTEEEAGFSKHEKDAGRNSTEMSTAERSGRAEVMAERANKKEEEAGEEGEKEGEEKEGEESEEGEEGEEKEIFTPLDLTCAIWLLALVSFNMSLFYFVNWPDPEMRIYVWTVISTTISIFIAIFIFASANLVCLRFLSSPDSSELWLAVLGFIQLTLWSMIMQFAVAHVSGAFEEHPFTADETIAQQKLDRMIRFKSVATLLAHITGFAAINAGGCLQHMHPFNQSAGWRFAVPPVMFVGSMIMGRVLRFLRTRLKNTLLDLRRAKGSYVALRIEGETEDMNEEELVLWCLEQWDDETYESEIDVAGLAISFLLVQATRFCITGVMPNNLGIEENVYVHPREDTWWLFGIGMAFATLTVLFVMWHANLPPMIQSGTLMSTVKRVVLIGQNTFSMAFAWCLFTSSKWEIARMLPQFEPNGVVSRVLLAMVIVAGVFIAILCLDHLADMESTGAVADRAIITIIYALSTLVGFSFEQSFDGAVEALSDLCFKAHPMEAELVLATLVCLIVYPAWRRHILRKLITMKDDYQKNAGVSESERAAVSDLQQA